MAEILIGAVLIVLLINLDWNISHVRWYMEKNNKLLEEITMRLRR